MFKKELVAIFAILLTIVCFIELTPTLYVSWLENKAHKESNGTEQSYKAKLDSLAKTDVINLKVKQYEYYDCQKKQLNLGLDLKGGINVMLEVSQKDLLRELSNNTTNQFFNQTLKDTDEAQKSSNKPYIDDFFTIYYKNRTNQNLNLPLASADIFGTQNLRQEIKFNSQDKDVEKVIKEKVENSVKTAFEVIRTRIDKFGATQPNVQRVPGSGRILVELPGATETDRVKKILQTSARLEFWEVYTREDLNPLLTEIAPKVSPFIAKSNPGNGLFTVNIKDTAKVNQILFAEKSKNSLKKTHLLWSSKPETGTDDLVLYAIKTTRNGKAQMEGSVKDAQVSIDQYNRVVVNMQMDAEGTTNWANLTQKNVGKPIAVVLDNLVYTAPNVNEAITGGSSQISGNFNQNEAKDLVDVLKSGKLPASAKIVQAEVIGATLGDEAVQNGFLSFIIAFSLVLIWMLIYYGKAGYYADLALFANLFFIIGIMASMSFTLTLPGIAGIVLTLGMAVDANIIIFERVKEEMRIGKNQKQAIEEGTNHALSAIIDSNVTTLLTAIILMIFGNGPIEGFAVTLIIGVFCTLFTAILLTRLFMQKRMDKNQDISFWTNFSKNLFTNVHINWMKMRKIAYIVSIILSLISVGSLFTQGLNLGVDYKGGRTYVVKFDKNVDPSKLSDDLSILLNDGVESKVDVKTYGGENQVKITTKYKIDSEELDVDKEIETKIYEGVKSNLKPGFAKSDFFNGSLKNVGIMSSTKVGPTVADDIQIKGFYAVGFALFGIFLYILLRFRRWEFSLAAVISLFHDALLVLGIFSIFYKIAPFSLEIDQAFIAAILTVIGYSIMDSVIVYDRIRENLKIHKTDANTKIFNDSINQTLGRTLNTSFSTLLVTAIIFIFGGEGIRGFMFALLIGIGIGTYSSTFIASALSFDFLNFTEKKKKNQ